MQEHCLGHTKEDKVSCWIKCHLIVLFEGWNILDGWSNILSSIFMVLKN